MAWAQKENSRAVCWTSGSPVLALNHCRSWSTSEISEMGTSQTRAAAFTSSWNSSSASVSSRSSARRLRRRWSSSGRGKQIGIRITAEDAQDYRVLAVWRSHVAWMSACGADADPDPWRSECLLLAEAV